MQTLTTIPLPAARTALRLAWGVVILTALHFVAMQLYFNNDLGIAESSGLRYWHVAMFDLDEEDSFGTWFSAINLLFCGRLLLAHARSRRVVGDQWHPWWLLLAIGFHILSVDEVAGMHEYLNTFMHVHETGVWTDVAMAGLAMIALTYLPFLLGLRRRTAVHFIVAGLIFAGGAVGVEHWTDAQTKTLHYNMWTILEEGMEMSGVIVMIYAVLEHMRGRPDAHLIIDVVRVVPEDAEVPAPSTDEPPPAMSPRHPCYPREAESAPPSVEHELPV